MLDINTIVTNKELIKKYSSKVIHLQIGNAQLMSTKSFTDWKTATDSTKTNDNNINPLQTINKILTTNNNVLDIKNFSYDLKDCIHYVTTYSEFSSNSSEIIDNYYIGYECFLPFQLKIKVDYTSLDKYDCHPLSLPLNQSVDQVWIQWNGNIFISYFCGNDDEYTDYDDDLASYVRETLTDIFKDNEIITCDYISPSPIHKDFTIILFSDDKIKQYPEICGLSFNNGDIIKTKSDFIIPIKISPNVDIDTAIHNSVKFVFLQLRSSLSSFYASMLIHTRIIDNSEYYDSILKNFNHDLISLINFKGYKFRYKSLLTKSINNNIIHLHAILENGYALQNELKCKMIEITNESNKNLIASSLKDYFIEMAVEPDDIDRECAMHILSHADNILTQHSTLNTQIISALIGAIVTVFLVFLGAYLF